MVQRQLGTLPAVLAVMTIAHEDLAPRQTGLWVWPPNEVLQANH